MRWVLNPAPLQNGYPSTQPPTVQEVSCNPQPPPCLAVSQLCSICQSHRCKVIPLCYFNLYCSDDWFKLVCLLSVGLSVDFFSPSGVFSIENVSQALFRASHKYHVVFLPCLLSSLMTIRCNQRLTNYFLQSLAYTVRSIINIQVPEFQTEASISKTFATIVFYV